MVRPQLEYSSSVWSPHSQTNIDKLERIQNRAARWVNSNYSTYDSVTLMKQQLNWQTLQDRRDYNRLIMFYKLIHGYVAIPIPPYFTQPKRLTRHQHPLSYLQIYTKVDYYKYSLFPYTTVLWNNLPSQIFL